MREAELVVAQAEAQVQVERALGKELVTTRQRQLESSMVAAHLAYIYAGVQEAELDARALFTLTSSRVFINVNHDFELEPEVDLQGRPTKGKDRKHAKHASSGGAGGGAGLGFQPLDVFDLWQRHLGKSLRWLGAHADQASELMEAVVRLLSGEEGRLLKTRVWRSLEGCGCFGRYVPEAASAEVEAELRAAAGKGFEPWLRARLSAATETEINVQLG